MIALRHILVPTDFSDPSAIALKYAKAFAENFQCSVHVLHVIDESALTYSWVVPEGAVPPPADPSEEDVLSRLRAQLSGLLTDAERERFRTRLVTRTGSPFVEIIRYARDQGIDLIVMGTHGRGPVAHMLLGSVAERVVRKAPCPVLTVRHPEHEFVMP